MILIGGCSWVFQDDYIKILDFSTKPFDCGDEIKAQRGSFLKLTFLDILGILEVNIAYFEEDTFWEFAQDVFSFLKRPFGTKSELIWLDKSLIFWEVRILV